MDAPVLTGYVIGPTADSFTMSSNQIYRFAIVACMILDLDVQMLVRSMRGRGPTRFYVWHGVDRSRLLKTAAAQRFSGFSFIGRAPRQRLTQRMLQHVR